MFIILNPARIVKKRQAALGDQVMLCLKIPHSLYKGVALLYHDGIHVAGTADSMSKDMTDILHLIKEHKRDPGAIKPVKR